MKRSFHFVKERLNLMAQTPSGLQLGLQQFSSRDQAADIRVSFVSSLVSSAA